jgi:hypothetical protein
MTFPDKKPRLQIWDDTKNARVVLTDTMAQQARDDPSAYPGAIEEGPETAKRLFCNRVSAVV